MARGGCRIEKRRGDFWGIIVGAIALIFASAIFGQSETGKGAAAPPGSSYSKDRGGLSAIYALLASYDRAIQWERQADRLPPEVRTIVIWDPEDLEEAAWQQALAWGESEGRRLVVADRSLRVPGKIDQELTGTVHSASATPLTVGVAEVSAGPGRFTRVDEPALVHLSRPGGAPVLISYPNGDGRIYWSADTEWLTNARIGQADNLTLALRLLDGGGVVAFDEYAHGYRAIDRWWQILRGSLRAFALQFAVALGLLLWAFGARFGSPRPALAVTPRAAVEYVVSMSQLYRQARARKVVARELYRSLTRELGRLLGGARGLSHAEVARRTAERTGLETEKITAVLNRLAPDEGPAPSETELITTAREVGEIQRRVRNAGPRDQ